MSRSGRLTPEQQLKFLIRVWGDDKDMGGWVFLPYIPGTTNSKAERRQNWNEGPAFDWPKDKDKVLAHIKERKNDDLYFSVNKFLEPNRVLQHVGESFALYADLDEVDPRSDIDPDMRPSIAWESSPDRFQCIWLMNGMEWDACAPGGLNQRLTQFIGADKSGFDTTQVLRVPGRSNWKYDYKDEDGRPAPGKLLWFSEKQYEWDFFEERLPEIKIYGTDIEVEEHELDAVDRHAVWGRVRLKCSHPVRTFMGMKTREVENSDYDRSETLWQIERDLADAGCTVAEIMAIVRASPWNKYAGRRNELIQLRSEAVKAKGVAEEEAGEDTLESAIDEPRPEGPRWVNDLVAERQIRPKWIVRNIWQKGSVGFISGEPKSYKSWFGLDMAISVATGEPFLNDPQFSTPGPGRALYLQEEDSLPLVLHRALQIIEEKAPKLSWAGRVTFDDTSHATGASGRSGTNLDVSLEMPADDVKLAMHVRAGFIASDPGWQSWLLEFLQEHQFAIVVIDTLGTTLGDVELNDSAKMNMRVLKPLKLIAEATGCAIAIVHHNKKAGDGAKVRAGQSMLGSTALHAWVESALYVRKGETMTGQPTQVFVERENKLAEDMKFRVRIPTMFMEKGHEEEGRRQLWEPEVLTGWGDPDATPGTEPVERDGQPRGGSRAGAKIVTVMAQMGGKNRRLATDTIVDVYGQSRGQCVRQLNHAERNGLIEGSHDDGWLIV